MGNGKGERMGRERGGVRGEDAVVCIDRFSRFKTVL